MHTPQPVGVQGGTRVRPNSSPGTPISLEGWHQISYKLLHSHNGSNLIPRPLPLKKRKEGHWPKFWAMLTMVTVLTASSIYS
jgi:hypothetical protein